MTMGRIWAVARNVMLEVVRLKGLMFFLILLTLAYTLGFAVWLDQSSGQADEKVQTFLSYSLSAMMAVLSFLTIFVSIATITRDIKRKEIFTITTKPIGRSQYLAGKLLGMAVLNLVLLVLSGSLIYGVTRGLAHYSSETESEKARLRELVLVARKSVKPPLPDVGGEVVKRVEQLAQQEIRDKAMTDPVQINAMRQKLYRDIFKLLITEKTAVAPGSHKVFHFENIVPVDRENGIVFIRYKQDVSVNPESLKTYGQWLIGPEDPLRVGGRGLETYDEIRTFHEFAVPVSDLSAYGDLYVAYRNPVENAPTSVIFPPDTGIEALYVVGGFEGNFLRALLAIYLRLLFLSVLGLAMGAWVSYPVAVLIALIVFLMGVCSNFILDAMKYEGGEVQGYMIQKIMQFVPNFSAYDPVPQIERGQVVPWEFIGQCGLYMILIKGGIIAFFGTLIFKFRELARVIV
jgi:hypothetical protein